MENEASMKALKGKEFKVLDKGFIRLVDVMGDDSAIVQAARTSYGKGTKSVNEDEGLIRYLMRHRHTTPFEMCELKFHVKVPMDTWRQWVRHRTASINEYSTRYSEAIDDKQETNSDEWRIQSNNNKQGSDGEFLKTEYDDENGKNGGDYFTLRENELHTLSEVVYKERLNRGIAREQARKDLPLSTYTMAYWKINLHNLLHFLSLRMDDHAQKEIRDYANVIGNEIVAKLFPLTWKAFQDYRVNSIQLSSRDIEMINDIQQIGSMHGEAEFYGNKMIEYNKFNWFDKREDGTLKNNRERQEFEEKAKRLGIRIPWRI